MMSSNSPLPPGIEDPPASAWDYSKEANLAGLEMHLRGVPLDEAKQIIVLFHGYGADGDDLVDLSSGAAWRLKEGKLISY
jgi:hypothetical protein